MNKLILMMFFLAQVVNAETINPKTVEELSQTSVRIYDQKEESGGTGSILKSFPDATHILTNKHVCRLIEQGGKVHRGNKLYDITHYKKFPTHDLCLVRIATGLDVNTEVAEKIAKQSQKVHVSGHPNLLPHITTTGHLSERMDIQLVVGIRECSEDEKTLECAWFGGKPDVKTFDSQVVSNLIKPGSSGSAVFNEDGHIVGVVYAGSGRDFSHGFIVPHIYVLFFLQNAHRFEWVKVGTPVDDEGYLDRIFNYNKCRDAQVKDSHKFNQIKTLCNSIQDNVIWRKQ